MPRFVVLLHETPAGYERGNHFDLMLEHGDVLLTWTVEQLPTKENPIEAGQLADHRLLYLDYEGPLTDGRGIVIRVDAGKFDWIERQPVRYVVQLRGEKLQGQLVIEQPDKNAHRWRVALSD